MSLVKFRALFDAERKQTFKVGGPIKVYGVTKKIVSIESVVLEAKMIEVNGTCEDFRQEPVNQLSMFGVDGL